MTNDPIDRLTKDEILDSLVSTQPLIPHLKLLLNRLCKSEVDDVVEERGNLVCKSKMSRFNSLRRQASGGYCGRECSLGMKFLLSQLPLQPVGRTNQVELDILEIGSLRFRIVDDRLKKILRREDGEEDEDEDSGMDLDHSPIHSSIPVLYEPNPIPTMSDLIITDRPSSKQVRFKPPVHPKVVSDLVCESQAPDDIHELSTDDINELSIESHRHPYAFLPTVPESEDDETYSTENDESDDEVIVPVLSLFGMCWTTLNSLVTPATTVYLAAQTESIVYDVERVQIFCKQMQKTCGVLALLHTLPKLHESVWIEFCKTLGLDRNTSFLSREVGGVVCVLFWFRLAGGGEVVWRETVKSVGMGWDEFVVLARVLEC